MKSAWPTALYTAQQVRALDAQQIAAGVSGFTLMQRAAQAAWQALFQRWPQVKSLSVIAGRGNNAGDGYLIACLALQAGWRVQILTLEDPSLLQADAALAYQAACSAGLSIQDWSAEQRLEGVVVDALLGTGVHGSVQGLYAEAIAAMNASGLPIVAVDIPSGLCADTGQILGIAVRAQLTVSFVGLKLGLFTGQGPDYVGEILFDALNVSPELIQSSARAAKAQRLTNETLPKLAPRVPTTHKGQLGHLWVVGGDRGTAGAALMAAEAGLRLGAGLLTLVTRPEHATAALIRCPEVMCIPAESSYALASAWQRCSSTRPVIVVGPGLGQQAWGNSLLSWVVEQDCPQVWDADALNRLASGAVQLPKDSLITPHPGEAARLLQCSIAEVQQDRPAAALALAQRYACVALLKGAGTLIAAPDGRLALCDRGHPAMASAGLGDVLAGVLGALRAQGLEAFEAACLGTWLHAVAGEQAAVQGRGLLATDLIPRIRQLLEEQSPCRG